MNEMDRKNRADGVQLTTMVALNNDENDEQCNSGPYDNTGSDDESDYDEVYGRLPYRSGFVLRHQNGPPSQVGVNIPSVEVTEDGDEVKTRSFSDSTLSRRNRTFMRSVRNKDLRSVQHELERDPNLTMYEDEHGVSALSVAVKGGPELIEPFLKKINDRFKLAIWVEHALLYAISADNFDSVKHLLSQRDKLIENEVRSKAAPLPKKGKTRRPKPEDDPNKNKMMTWSNRHKSGQILQEFEDAEFPIYLTPAVLAAKLHRVDIILLLQERGACEIHPITKQCPLAVARHSKSQLGPDACEICRERRIFKTKRQVEESKRLIEIYKALSSPSFIFNSGVDDPVLEAFELSREMSNLAIEDAPFKAEYEQICKNCREFACDLLDLCRSTEEIETLLSITEGVHEVNSHAAEDAFPRILVALSYAQKEFITHPSCQQVLQRKWFEGLPDWVNETERRSLNFVIYILLWCLCWPFACVFFMLKIWPWVITFMKHPINKFISDTISFAVFLLLLVIECSNNRDNQRARDWFTVTEGFIIAWVIGMMSRQMKMMYRHRMACSGDAGPGSLSRGVWRWYDMVLLVCFFIWMVLYLIGVAMMYVKHKEDQERHEWHSWNPILISEGFFSLGTLLSFVKLVGLFKASSSLGPLQISLKLMLNDILRFLVIFFITMTGFVMAITNLYSHYEGHIRMEEHEEMRNQTDDLIAIRSTYKTLFWALFGYGDPEVADVVVGNSKVDGNGTVETVGEVVKHKVTESYGYILFGSYHIVVIIVLINMLIAMMARSYEVIESNSDREWKYARTKLRMIYFSEVGSLPPPFNILLIGTFMKWVLSCCTKCSAWCKRKYDPPPYKPHRDYEALMKKLSKRYLNSKLTKVNEEENMLK